MIVLVVVLWPVFDQVVVMFQRSVGSVNLFEFPEFAASGLGTWLGWCACWIIKPYAGIAEKKRRAFRKFAFFYALHQKSNRKVIFFRVLLMVIGGVVLIPLLIFVIGIYQRSNSNTTGIISPSTYAFLFLVLIGGLMGFIFAIGTDWRSVLMKRSNELLETKPCFKCGESCCGVLFDASGWGVCINCSEPIHKGQWIVLQDLKDTSDKQFHKIIRAIFKPMVISLLPFGFIFVLIFQIDSPGFVAIAGFPLVLIILLIMISRSLNIEVAYRYDRQHIECRECGYELKGIVIEEGVGICPECGLCFARFVKD